MQVGVIGLGAMGMGVALTLLKKGFAVTGCDLREEARAAFAAAGGAVVARAADLPEALEAVVILVVNEAQERAVLFGPEGCVPRLQKGSVVMCSATIAPAAAREIGDLLAKAGLWMLDAPVSGGAAAARGGSLTVMASGPAAAFLRAKPVLDAIAAKVWQLGETIGAGSTVKMINQLLAGVHIAVAAEALAFGIRAGADPKTLYEVISTSAGSSWMWQNRVPHILQGDDTPLSAVNIFVKDLGIVLDQARALTFPLPLAAAAHQLFLAAAAHGEGAKDDAFVIRVWEALAGIALPGKEAGGKSET
ncbi:MAG: NAD(P)-dependent oxidoreductase [Acidobacteriia bacterium]|nr:NAD(P)-dependent oxidoreductase [Methyloceanibacter sp.]MCL6491994.1 NAD(P)-dependent oxidoreductase [Terriglobia bacterium]